MKQLEFPQSRCRAAVARGDITPPVGIYHRMWGAAVHDRATGVHRPLTATLLWLAPIEGEVSSGRLIVSLDHCILDGVEIAAIQEGVSRETGVDPSHVLVTLTHTHGSAWMSRTRADKPGGDLIGPYLDQMIADVVCWAVEAYGRLEVATIVYGQSRCSLARQRDYLDEETRQIVCGFNPGASSDDTVLVARVETESRQLLATIVNYACHPTTLAWENTLISPDWPGAMREVVEAVEDGPCLFLQGASGDLGPRHGFTGDVEVADRNGRQVGYAALEGLTEVPPGGQVFRYAGAVLSGATLGVWKYERLLAESLKRNARFRWMTEVFPLAVRTDLPTKAETIAALAHWEAEEERARERGDHAGFAKCRAEAEQRRRQLARLEALPEGTTIPLPVEIAVLGGAVWIFTPGELYQQFQTQLRERLAPYPVVVTTLTNGWQPGYIPPQNVYGRGIYQERIAATAPGCLERLIEEVGRRAAALIGGE